MQMTAHLILLQSSRSLFTIQISVSVEQIHLFDVSLDLLLLLILLESVIYCLSSQDFICFQEKRCETSSCWDSVKWDFSLTGKLNELFLIALYVLSFYKIVLVFFKFIAVSLVLL